MPLRITIAVNDILKIILEFMLARGNIMKGRTYMSTSSPVTVNGGENHRTAAGERSAVTIASHGFLIY